MTKPGKIDVGKLRNIVNKSAGTTVAFNLTKDDSPTAIHEWIPTGSRWLDSIICKGILAGIPVGRITEIAGVESSGKSYMAAQIIANAQRMGKTAVLFDSETATDASFLTKLGVDVDSLIWVQATSVEFVLETIEMLMKQQNDMVFVLDSLGNCPCKADIEAGFNPNSKVGLKARVMSLGLQKLNTPIANTNSTLVITGQLKTNITDNKWDRLAEPWVVSGGKATAYNYSLRIWLTRRKAKSSFIFDEKGYKVGNELKCTLKKSRFGTEGRFCNFNIIWGSEEIGIQDDLSLLDAVKSSPYLKMGQWNTLMYADGTTEKFQRAGWLEKMKNEKFRDRIMDLMDEEVILKFETKEGDASNFYDDDTEEEVEGSGEGE
jgi:recombination protein RecA